MIILISESAMCLENKGEERKNLMSQTWPGSPKPLLFGGVARLPFPYWLFASRAEMG